MFTYVHSFVLQSGLALVHEMVVYILLCLICFYFSRLQQVHSTSSREQKRFLYLFLSSSISSLS